MSENRLVKRRNGFSERNNTYNFSKEIQYVDFNERTRTKLKNFTFTIIDGYINTFQYDFDGQRTIVRLFAEELFCVSTRGNISEFKTIEGMVNKVFDSGGYDEILDTIEFIASAIKLKNPDYSPYFAGDYGPEFFDLKSDYNQLFEEEYIGYRFLENRIVRITNKEEINTIKEATNTVYDNVNKHISKAISYISETEKDYRNSIKESVTAVETLCSIVSGKDKGTLGETINIIAKEKHMHSALKEAISKLYGFASDEPGIRHGSSKEGNDIAFDDAKFILVTCSAIINYILGTLAKR